MYVCMYRYAYVIIYIIYLYIYICTYLRLNNHHEDVCKADTIPASCYFAMEDHIFNRDTSFIKIE